jgi:hypothetical protein
MSIVRRTTNRDRINHLHPDVRQVLHILMVKAALSDPHPDWETYAFAALTDWDRIRSAGADIFINDIQMAQKIMERLRAEPVWDRLRSGHMRLETSWG